MVISQEWGADLHMSQLMPLPLTVSCFSKIQIGFAFLVLADPGNLEQRAIKRLCVFLLDPNLTIFPPSSCPHLRFGPPANHVRAINDFIELYIISGVQTKKYSSILTWAVSKFGRHQLHTVSSMTHSTGRWSGRPNIYRHKDRHTWTTIHKHASIYSKVTV